MSLKSLAIRCYWYYSDRGITNLNYFESVPQLPLSRHTYCIIKNNYSSIHSSQLIRYVLTLNSTWTKVSLSTNGLELVNCSMSLTSRKRCALTTHFVEFNVLGVGDFIVKKSFSSLLGIRFGINNDFQAKVSSKIMRIIWLFMFIVQLPTLLFWYCFLFNIYFLKYWQIKNHSQHIRGVLDF